MKYRKMMELVEALRSGRFKQTTGAMRVYRNPPRARYDYCCLGVACIVAGRRFDASENKCDGTNSYLPPKAMAYFGFHHSRGTPLDKGKIVVGPKKYDNLAAANDDGRTFAEIAKAIRDNWRRL